MRTVPLQQICDIQIGKTPSRSVPEYWGGELPWVTISDFAAGRIVTTTQERITRIGAAKSGSKRIPRGTLLLSFKLSLGKRALSGCDLFTNEAIAALHVLDHDVADRDYLYWALGSIDYDRLVDRAAKGKTLNKAKLKILKIPLPPLDKQKRIAGILDAADALRAKRREAIAQLDTLLQSTLLDMFGDPVTNPKGWNVVAFESIGNSRLGKMLDKGKEVGDRQFPYLANTNVQWGRFDLTALRTMDFSESDCEEFKLEDGDLLICEGGEVGRTAIWHGAHNRIYFQKALHRVRLDPTVAVPEYVFQFMWFMAKNGGFRDLTTSATIAHLTGVKLKRLPCPRPPLKLQHRYAVIVKSVEQQKTSQRAHLADLDTLFTSLQARAFRGDL